MVAVTTERGELKAWNGRFPAGNVLENSLSVPDVSTPTVNRRNVRFPAIQSTKPRHASRIISPVTARMARDVISFTGVWWFCLFMTD